MFAALDGRGTGRSMSRRIARHLTTMDAVHTADAEAIQQVDGAGSEKALVVVAELIEPAPLIDRLVQTWVNMTEPGATPPTHRRRGAKVELPLPAMSVVVTRTTTRPGRRRRRRSTRSMRSTN
ncbi:hypothetical protein [Nonomuraea jabiensis]|uniref:hypothetical protein n=1 Tax=Nonomuraea jabiensis TaxID=882448 RepID=UPI003D704440